jgi:hypothetical protein
MFHGQGDCIAYHGRNTVTKSCRFILGLAIVIIVAVSGPHMSPDSSLAAMVSPDRVALVIVNDAYDGLPDLHYAGRDRQPAQLYRLSCHQEPLGQSR